MTALALQLFQLVAVACSGPACPSPCDECTYPPVEGSDPPLEDLQALFESVAQREDADGRPDIRTIEIGLDEVDAEPPFPCRLLPAIGATESGVRQFCPDSGLSIISFDCGYGIMQVTSGVDRFPGLEARVDINVAAGADILATKWNAEESFGGVIGERDPQFVESWYFAVWAYNGFAYKNNPNNPNLPEERPPFRSPASLARANYPYQEIVWGYLEFPLERDGELLWESLAPSYPNRADIPNQSGLFSVSVPLPSPAHTDACAEACPPDGCPEPDARELILDDADPGFTVEGPVETHGEGGFRDTFLSAAVAFEGAPTVHAHFEGVAPSSGTFELAGFIPLDPATSADVHVRVRARGNERIFLLNQSVNGGFFAPLGEVVLAEGVPVSIEVTNDSRDGDSGARVGIDAFRFTWRGDGITEPGAECDDDAQCAGDALCVDARCTEDCNSAGCASGACNEASGLCMGAPAVVSCSCQGSDAGTALAFVLWVTVCGAARRRRVSAATRTCGSAASVKRRNGRADPHAT